VSPGFTWVGVKKTSSRTCRLLHQVCFTLEELGVNRAFLEFLVGHHPAQEWNRSCHPLDDKALQRDLHAPQRFGTVAALTNELGEPRVLSPRDTVPGVDVGVEADTRPAGRMKDVDAPG